FTASITRIRASGYLYVLLPTLIHLPHLLFLIHMQVHADEHVNFVDQPPITFRLIHHDSIIVQPAYIVMRPKILCNSVNIMQQSTPNKELSQQHKHSLHSSFCS
ncbi:hypothetical protein B9Q03_11580, partial [Candidatus Marsarchaeota G2 archaeon OSP_D]